MKHVRQQHPFGCVVASLAMITGLTYDAVHKSFPFTDFDKEGLSIFLWEPWLAEHGYAIRPFCKHYAPAKQDRPVWPPAPFADVHIVTVITVEGAHCVVMRRDGSVLDPMRDEPTTLRDPVYLGVYAVAGVYHVEGL